MNDLKERLLGELAAHCDSIDRLWAVIRVMADGLPDGNAEPEIMEKVFWHILNSLQDMKNEAQDICGEIANEIIRGVSRHEQEGLGEEAAGRLPDLSGGAVQQAG